MTRGRASELGEEHVAPNGYAYRKVEDKGDGNPGWKLIHHIIAEERLGRPVNTKTERVIFVDRNPSNLHPDNIKVLPKGNGSLTAKQARLESRIQELQAELAEVNRELSVE